MPLSTDWPLHKIAEPHETNDVLLMETIDRDLTQGNQRLVELIHSRREDYTQKSRMEKPLVAVEILKEWRSQDPPGRFLVEEFDSHPPLFRDVGDKKARTHIGKLLKQAVLENNNDKTEIINGGPSNPGLFQTQYSQQSRKELDWRSVASKLYEREEQAKKLLAAFERSRHTENIMKPELVLICGPSGSGKSELARSIEDYVTSEGGFFLWGKYDQYDKTKTYSAFFAAFQQFTRLLQWKEDAWKDNLRDSVQASAGSELHILVEAMPFLGSFLDVQEALEATANHTGKGSEKSKKRFTIAFRRFVRALLDPQHPIILVLDDLQWADLGSLDLLHSLVSPQFGNRQGLMIVGTCRGNEVSLNDPLSHHLRELEDNEGTTITNIEVANLSVDTLTQMIVDAGMPEEQGSLLAEIVHSQTRGNAFFSTQYLKNLQEEGLLKRESSEAEWEFNEDELQLSSRSAGYDDQIVRLLAKKMMQLPLEVQDVLKVAACIGSEVRENLLIHACSVSSSTVLLALCVAEERGLIIYNFDYGLGRFAHDRFQEAAMSLLPADKRPSFQLQIGRTLRARLSEEEFSTSLLLIASLMVQGVNHIEDEDERDKLARLCLAAARSAAKASAFASAIQYIESGMTLLTSRHWRDQYDLSLLLYSTGCELAYCNGDHEMVERLTNEVVENARSFKDKVHVYTSLILSLDSRWQFEEATDVCFAILDHCGERFPRKVGKAGILIDFLKTQWVLRGVTAHGILNLPAMVDPIAVTTMSVIHLLYPIVLLSNFRLAPLTAFRLVRLTLRYGQSPMSSVGFAFYASVLVRLGKIEEGCFYGNLALQLKEKHHQVTEFAARTTIALWGNVLTETEPLSKCLEPYMSAHHAALSTGDFNSAMVSMFCHCLLRFFLGGDPLASVADSLVHAQQLSKDYNQMTMEIMTDPLLQACYNLMGRSADPLVLTGEAMDEDRWKESSRETDEQMHFFVISIKMHIAIYMNAVDDSLLKEFRKKNRGRIIPYIFYYYIFFEGLIEATRASPLSRWRARRHLRCLEKAMLRCPENFSNKVFLIKAELAASAGKDEYALLAFDKSIRYAEKEGLMSEKGLASEKAARMLLSIGRKSEAATYLDKAIILYSKWGAEVKVVQLQKLIAKEKLDMAGEV